ncbi:MAG: type II secretion system protein GspD, partial [Longimicrobiales bacterium]
NNLSIRELPSGVMIVESGRATALRTETEPLESQQFVIQYVSADSLQTAIEGLLTEQGNVSVNRSSNAILVTDTRSALDRIAPLVEQLDVRTAQVNISARIAFVNRTSLEQLGFVYDLKDSRGNQLSGVVTNVDPNTGAPVAEDLILLGGNSIAALGNATARVPEPTLRLALSLVLGRHTLISFLEALQTVNLTDVQASPVVTTLDHRAARIQVGQETPVRVIDLGSQTGGQGAPRSTIEYKQTGVILNVTPHVTGNLVMLEIQAERSNVQPGASDAGIVFETSNAQTQVLVQDGETAVIAGLTETQRTQTRSGIPILMDLPVIGKLFRRTSEEEVQRDLLIMVTPHIVRD